MYGVPANPVATRWPLSATSRARRSPARVAVRVVEETEDDRQRVDRRGVARDGPVGLDVVAVEGLPRGLGQPGELFGLLGAAGQGRRLGDHHGTAVDARGRHDAVVGLGLERPVGMRLRVEPVAELEARCPTARWATAWTRRGVRGRPSSRTGPRAPRARRTPATAPTAPTPPRRSRSRPSRGRGNSVGCSMYFRASGTTKGTSPSWARCSMARSTSQSRRNPPTS